MLVFVLIILLAIAGGFLGDLLELAGWLILILALAGAVIGYVGYRAVQNFLGRSD